MNIFDIAMADLEKKTSERVWTEDVMNVITEGRKQGKSWKDITAVLNKHFFADNPATVASVDTKWRRDQ
jgi:hypothetical protein